MIEPTVPAVSRDKLREAIKAEYGELAMAFGTLGITFGARKPG